VHGDVLLGALREWQGADMPSCHRQRMGRTGDARAREIVSRRESICG
jgi:hypothetical protein